MEPVENGINHKATEDEDPRPNPTLPLHWSSFPGSIQDIFSRNAISHPDRICVTETPGSSSSSAPERESSSSGRAGERERKFTYGQIWRAANVLSWGLVEKGVRR